LTPAEGRRTHRSSRSPRGPRYRTGDPALDERIKALVDSLGEDNPDLIFELMVSVARLAREKSDRGDLKLVNASLRELRLAFEVFKPYRTQRKASIFGSARTREDDPLYEQTVDVARRLADAEWMVITGAGPGIMAAGIEGAGPDASFGLPIRLPFEAAALQLPPDRVIDFRYFFTRKLTFIKESDGFVLLPGGFGTLDEAFELLTLCQTGKAPMNPIVLLDVPGGTYWSEWLEFVRGELGRRGYIAEDDLAMVFLTDDTSAAVAELTGFYANYHSQRYVQGDLVLRLHRPASPSLLAQLNEHFGDIVVRGAIEAIDATPDEVADGDHPDLPRIRFRFDRYHHARLRQLIDALNRDG
jgi:uncharacterized protein (TIGR00730 family)